MTWLLIALAAGLGAMAGPLVLGIAARAQTTPVAPSARSRIPVAAVLLAVVAALLCWRLGPSHALATAPLLLLGVPAAVVDWREQRLPDALTLPLAVAAAVALAVLSAVEADPGAWGRAVSAAAIMGLALLLLGLAWPAAVGLGDIKFAPGLAAYLGWSGWLTVSVGAVAWWACLVVFLLLYRLHRADRPAGADMPFGPALLAGTLLTLLVVP